MNWNWKWAVLLFAATAGWDANGAVLEVNSQMSGLAKGHDFPPVKLRGYGTLAAKEWTDISGGSLLQIDCQDAEHARLLQAKYLSDLAELPPGTQPAIIDVGGAKISIQNADNVGSVAALRNGTTVVIASAPTAEALNKLIAAGLSGSPAGWTSVAEGTVPMYLDRFDKYGFRFYYSPDELPNGANGQPDTSYDKRKDFDYMQANHAGLQVWQRAEPGETTQGLTEMPTWKWALDEAKQTGRPFGINLGIESSATWYYNRNPAAEQQFVPDFLGTYYGSMNFGIGPYVSWSSPLGQDIMMGCLQDTVRKLNNVDNITSWLEPHEELGGGAADLFVDYGPQADVNFRHYLRGLYHTIGAVSQRYDGNATTLTAWDQVHAPELADFLGWSADAVDLAGRWKVSFDDADNTAALAPGFDDSSWGEMNGPGDGLARMLQEKPALWRRHFTVDAGWLSKHPAVWLYVWDMNDNRGADTDPRRAVVVALNGLVQKEERPYYAQDHWTALDVTKVVQAGDNFLSVRLPSGLFNYRVYLSGGAPKSYPQLGEGKNAQWVDFSNWLSYTRKMGVQRGMQMIRQVDPNRGIMLMAPDTYQDDVLDEAIAYGGDFHNTGYMAGWWCDRQPALVRSVGLPFSTEPSQGPTVPMNLLGEFGNWITEGVNAVDQFQSLGEILYHPDLKKTFEDHAKLYTSLGRYHAPAAQIAALYSNRINNLLGFPWIGRPAIADNHQPYYRGGGYPSGFNARGLFSNMENNPKGLEYESDAVDELRLAENRAGKYRAIVDTDTVVMDQATIDGIERYVRAGGVFITYGETGRHSPEKPDSWPIERLTGFHVMSLIPGNGTLSLAPGQKVFPGPWTVHDSFFGLHLKPVVPEATSLLNWDDGTVAAGIRPLGKGYVISLALDPWYGNEGGHAFYTGIFQWLKLDAIPANLETASTKIYWRHLISNNGLFDLWVFRNYDSTQPAQGTLVLDPGMRPPWSVDLNSGTRTAVTDGRLPVNLPPGETVISITPRRDIAASSSDWLTLQRGYWQGTESAGTPLARPKLNLTIDLTPDWLFKAVDPAQKDVSALVDPKTDDSAWEKMPLGIFTLPNHPDVRHLVVRKHIHIPANWNHGRTLIRLEDDHDDWQAYIDGKPYNTWSMPDPVLAAGSDHLLAVECQGPGDLLGAQSDAWLTYHPDPVSKQDLAGKWETSSDYLKWNGSVTLPGQAAQDVKAMRTTFQLDPASAGKTVVFHVDERNRGVRGIIINGQYEVPPGREGNEFNYNITPWLKPGQPNEIVVIGGGGETIREISLEHHVPGTYP
jgi:hypothetical protein